MKTPNKLPTVLHVEDDPIIRSAIGRHICEWAEFDYLGAAATVASGIELCRIHRPDILLLDLQLPDGSGFELLSEIGKEPKQSRVLLLTCIANESTYYKLRRVGIAGMIWKAGFSPEILYQGLKETSAGRSYFPPEVSQAMNRARSDPQAFFKILSEREMDLLPYFADGQTDEEIGKAKGIAPLTVKSHRTHIMTKLNLHGTEKLMRWAAERGFVRSIGSKS